MKRYVNRSEMPSVEQQFAIDEDFRDREQQTEDSKKTRGALMHSFPFSHRTSDWYWAQRREEEHLRRNRLAESVSAPRLHSELTEEKAAQLLEEIFEQASPKQRKELEKIMGRRGMPLHEKRVYEVFATGCIAILIGGFALRRFPLLNFCFVLVVGRLMADRVDYWCNPERYGWDHWV